jgi:dTDP-4-dehydrorhamnose reductase
MKVLVTGSKGMLGSDLCILLAKNSFEVIPVTQQDFDITDKLKCEIFLNAIDFDAMVHCAAYTNVDGAENDRKTAFAVNATATQYLSQITAHKNVPIIYISTDYVFDGTKNSPYKPSDTTNPLNVYGESKLTGEQFVKSSPKHYIVRTSWLYGIHGSNFVETMLNLAKTQPFLKVVDDQFGCPSWTCDVAEGIIKLLKTQQPYGTYHLCGGGQTSWFDFAREILKTAKIEKEVIPVKTNEFPRPAQRPAFSVMDNDGLLRDWKEALKDYMKNRKFFK